jgi:hypothetical protein
MGIPDSAEHYEATIDLSTRQEEFLFDEKL